MEKKKKKQKLTKDQFIKKIFKFILVAYILTLFIIFIMENYVKDNRSIYEKIGTLAPYSTSIKNALNIKAYGILPYADCIVSGDTKSAYEMLTEEYQEAVSYEEYLKTIEGIDFTTFDLKEIKIKAENTFVGTVEYEKNGEETTNDYLLYLNEINPRVISMSPDKFIYSFNNLKFKRDSIELKLEKCMIYTDNIKIKVLIKNTSLFDTMTFTNIGVGYGEVTNKEQNVDIVLAPRETRELELEYETEYFIPNNIKVKRNLNEEILRTYTFYFEK